MSDKTNPNILSSFEKSKKDTLDLITLKNKKLKGDKQGLRCSFKGCDFITTITKKCKAKKKIRIHEETHKALTNIETTNDDQARSMSNVEIARSVTPEGKYADKTNRTVTNADENETIIVETKVKTKITENTIDTKIEHTNDGYNRAGTSQLEQLADNAAVERLLASDDDADGVLMKHEANCWLCGTLINTVDWEKYCPD